LKQANGRTVGANLSNHSRSGELAQHTDFKHAVT